MKYICKNRSRNKVPKGFTLIETMVAISILMISIAAPMTLVQKSLSASSLATQQITASFLAQDALEYVQSVRDRQVGTGGDWLNGLASSCGANGCRIDTNKNIVSDAISACNPSCPKIKYNKDDGMYNYTRGEESIFKRTVIVVETTSNVRASVTAKVEWDAGQLNRKVELKKELFNWQK